MSVCVYASLHVSIDVATGMTGMHIAARDGKEAMLLYLLNKCKVLPDEEDRNGCTPMMLAAENGHETIVSMLLERGARANSELYGLNPFPL